ncbi:ATP-binding protein [uncultured Rhodospira sp.]|uniref:ATP-binding protein n=1 Tax=uncultured Rhodospira sp. TaxID=1936189 RepID=UPI00261F99E9|nr:ATP-binding protein [uncultured Rhodospira sp.]
MTDSAADLPTVDLSECENEPIHLLELVQPHGCILVLGRHPLTVLSASANTDSILGESAESLLGRPIDTILDALAVNALKCLQALPHRAEPVPPAGVYARPLARGGSAGRLRATAHRADQSRQPRLIVELEPVAENDEDAAEQTYAAEAVAEPSMRENENLYLFLDQTVNAIAGLTDYDRVMAYKFHPDWSGEVVAEVCHPDLTPYLGLRYPASDIPSQARRLYLDNRLRVIVDVGATPAPMVRASSVADEPPLDLGHATLRSVSSYHIEYLRNMGVGATMVASLIVDGALWGLIACHHMTPKIVPWHQREAAARIVGRVSDRIADILSLQSDRQSRRIHRFLTMSRSRADDRFGIVDALFFGTPRLSDVIRCDGVTIHVQGRTASIGNTPPGDAIGPFLDVAWRQAEDGIFASHELSADPAFEGLPLANSHGALVAFPGADHSVALICFRDEVEHEVHWGGDPNKPVEVDRASNRLSPRKSFNLWRQGVKGQARPWEPWTLDLIRGAAEMLLRGPDEGLDVDGDGRPDPIPAAAAATLTAAMDDLFARFEMRTEALLEGLDLVDNGALLAVPWARNGGEDIAVAANQAFRTHFDVDTGDVGGRPVREVLTAMGLPGSIAALPLGQTKEVEWWSGKDGHRTLRVLRRGLFSVARTGSDARKDDERAWVIYTFDDVTHLYRTQRALGAARQQALARARGRTEFLAQLARELRDPLHAIESFAETLDQSTGPVRTDRYREYAGKIRDLSGDLLDLLNETLDMTRLERGGEHTDSSVFDLTVMVGDLCRSVQESHRHHDTSWDWHLPNERIMVHGDRDALRHAFLTLITAALRASPAGGMVMVRLVMDRSGEPRLSVSDTGLGLGEEDLMALRRPLDPTLARDTGTMVPKRGLGLALARALVDLHGGAVTVTSNPGTGTTVNVTLPRHRVVDRDNPPSG